MVVVPNILENEGVWVVWSRIFNSSIPVVMLFMSRVNFSIFARFLTMVPVDLAVSSLLSAKSCAADAVEFSISVFLNPSDNANVSAKSARAEVIAMT